METLGSVGKMMASDFYHFSYSEGVTIKDYLEKGKTINERYYALEFKKKLRADNITIYTKWQLRL